MTGEGADRKVSSLEECDISGWSPTVLACDRTVILGEET